MGEQPERSVALEHEMKTLPAFFDAVQSGVKSFEVRRDDRGGFQVDDLLVLQEWDGAAYTGRSACRRITYVLQGEEAERFGVQPGFAVLGLADAPAVQPVPLAAIGCCPRPQMACPLGCPGWTADDMRRLVASLTAPSPAAVQPVAYMVETPGILHSGVMFVQEGASLDSYRSHPSVYSVTPLYAGPLAAPQAGAAPRDDEDECVSPDGACHFGLHDTQCRFCLRVDEGQRLALVRENARVAMDGGRVPDASWLDTAFVLQVLDKALAALRPGAAPVDAREREKDARWVEQLADQWRPLQRNADPVFHARALRIAAALRGALPDTRVQALEDALEKAPHCAVVVHDAIMRGDADAPVTPQGATYAVEKLLRALVLDTLNPEPSGEPDHDGDGFYHFSGAALSGTPGPHDSDAPAQEPRRMEMPADWVEPPNEWVNAAGQRVNMYGHLSEPAVTAPETLDITAPSAQHVVWTDAACGRFVKCAACGYEWNRPDRLSCANCDADGIANAAAPPAQRGET